MKKYILNFVFILCTLFANAQNQNKHFKPLIDSNAINKWISLGSSVALSNDGTYFLYTIKNLPIRKSTLVVEAIDKTWKKEFILNEEDPLGIFFSGDGKQVIFKNEDTLFFLPIRSFVPRVVTGVISWSRPKKDNGRWIAYQLKGSSHEMILQDLITGKEQHLNSVSDYIFSEDGDAVVYKTETAPNGDALTSLWRTNLPERKSTEIWSNQSKETSGMALKGYAMDQDGNQITFVVQEKINAKIVNTIWYCNDKLNRAIVKVTNLSQGIDNGFAISSLTPSFSGDGKYLFVQLEKVEKEYGKPSAGTASVDVWNYRDKILQTTQFYISPKNYTAAMSMTSDKVVQIGHDHQNVYLSDRGDFAAVVFDNEEQLFWEKKTDTLWLVSLKNGDKKVIDIRDRRIQDLSFSPKGKYFVYFDDSPKNSRYISYNTQTGNKATISSTISNEKLYSSYEFLPGDFATSPAGIGAWDDMDLTMLVYGEYDIWQVDLSGVTAARNITNGFGKAHNTKFRLINKDESDLYNHSFIYKNNDSLLLTAYNINDKYNGFYQVSVGEKRNPKLLAMGRWTIYHSTASVLPPNAEEFNEPMKPLRAGKSNVWVVRRESAKESPNYFLTTGFKSYDPLTNIHPEQNFNWLTANLVNYRLADGTITQAVLYEPENFDTRKKYPVIINYYEQLSHRLFEYPTPEFTSSGFIDIPSFVSNGYLILTIDIQYKSVTERCQYALSSVVSAAHFLAELGYVNTKKIGICGQSWGGTQTNYIITHSNHLFAAALSTSAGHNGVDLISNALSIDPGRDNRGRNELDRYERDIGFTLWQRPDLWIKNSPIFQVDQVKTPLLFMNNKADYNWDRAIEMFIALRRLGKEAYLLQYDHGGHTLETKEDKEDFTIRITQFFDHYLKDAPAPVWMTRGIPASMKGATDGFEYDKEINTPPNSPLTYDKYNPLSYTKKSCQNFKVKRKKVLKNSEKNKGNLSH